MYCSLIYFNIPFIYVFLSRSLYSAKDISAMDTLPAICLGCDVAFNNSKFIIIIIIIIIVVVVVVVVVIIIITYIIIMNNTSNVQLLIIAMCNFATFLNNTKLF